MYRRVLAATLLAVPAVLGLGGPADAEPAGEGLLKAFKANQPAASPAAPPAPAKPAAPSEKPPLSATTGSALVAPGQRVALQKH